MLKKKTVVNVYKEIIKELLHNDPVAGYCLFENRVKYNNVLLGNNELFNYLLDSDIIIDWDNLDVIDVNDDVNNDKLGYTSIDGLVDDILNKLNRLFHKDNCALHSLWCNNTPCNALLLHHSLICVEMNRALNEHTIIGIPQILFSLLLHLKSERFVCLNWEQVDDTQNALIGFTTYIID